MKICILVFAWDWQYLGQRMIDGPPSIFPAQSDICAWDRWSLAAAKQIAPEAKDIHAACAIIEGPGNELEVTPEMIDFLKHARDAKIINHSETWDYGASTVKRFNRHV